MAELTDRTDDSMQAANKPTAAPQQRSKATSAKQKNTMVAAGLSIVTAPLQGALAQLAVHDPNSDHTPMEAMMRKSAIAGAALMGAKASITQGFRQGAAEAKAEREAKEARTISIPKAELQGDVSNAGVGAALRRDLGLLAQDDRTALDINRRMPAEMVGKRFDAAMAAPGDTLRIDLHDVGLRVSPNLKRALSEYGSGGRETLAADKLVPSPVKPRPEPSKYTARGSTQPPNRSQSRTQTRSARGGRDSEGL